MHKIFDAHDALHYPKSQQAIAKATFRMMSDVGWTPREHRVLIKPNIGAKSTMVNTEPEVVKGLIMYLRSIGIEDKDVIIGEGSVETECERSDYNFHHQGWDRLAEEMNVSLVDLNKAEREATRWKYGDILLPKLLNNRAYINVAKMKTHMQTLVSLCLKNQKGLLDSKTRKEFHKLELHEPIARLGELVTPDFNIVDAIVGIEGNGPGDYGKKRNVGLLVASDSMAEIDSVCCGIMGVDPDEPEHLRLYRQYRQFTSKYDLYKLPRPFLRPAELKMFNVHMKPENACTACQASIGQMNRLARKSLKGISWFGRKGILGRLDIVMGSPKEVPKKHGYIVFYGNCAKDIASRYPEYPFIQGCPPVSKKALEQLAHTQGE